jgi:hypothetical protein
LGDPACDLVIAWTYLKEKAREIFIQETGLHAGLSSSFLKTMGNNDNPSSHDPEPDTV